MTTKYKPPRLRNLKPDKRKGRKKRYLLIPLFLVLLLGAGVLLMLGLVRQSPRGSLPYS